MLRSLAFALSLAFATNALAVTPEELDLQKAEVKYAKDVSKSVGKIVKKWHKALDKGKPTAEYDKELKPYYRNELSWLRAKGVKTVDEEPPLQHPAHPEKVLPAPPSETPKMEALRDLVVELKKGELKPKAQSKKLDEYVNKLESRYERKNIAYKEAKKG